MKQIVLLLILVPALSFGQSKKELREQIVSLQLDSANQEELISDQKEKIYEMEQTISSQTRILLEAQNDIALMYSRISELNKQLKESEESISTLENEVFNLTLEKEMLQVQLDSALNRLNHYELNSYSNQGPFDFKYDYENGNGYNSPEIYPIGWSDNGVVAYREDYCIEPCGCCGTAIIIRDIKSNVTLGYQFNPGGDAYDHTNGSGSSLWDDQDYKNSTRELLAAYEIFPTRFARYSTSSYIPSCRGDIEVIVEKNGKHYYVKTRNNGALQLVYQGDLEEDPINNWSNVDFAGFFLDESDQFPTIVLMHGQYGFESALDFKIELVGLELP